TFYDQKFKRLYIEVEGTIVVSKSISKTFIKGEKIYSSDGQLAFDLVFKNPTAKGDNFLYQIDGELIIFQESIIESIARLTPGGNTAYSPVGETILKFLEEARIRQLADIAAETLTSFSPEKLDQLKAELKKRSDEMGDTNLKKILFLTEKTGHFAKFFILSLVKSIPGMIGESAGASIGSVVGSFLMPGPGTLVGAYIGSVISGQIVYAIQYRIPINLKLARMKTLWKICQKHASDSIAAKKFNSVKAKFNQDIRDDLDKHSYIVVDEVLNILKNLKKDRPGLMKIIAGDLTEILQNQLVHENDRYAERKLKQLKEI
ncbi:MAG: hypothetical protein AB1403_14265, partial [Candidatus Riflebacteria bacterium]